MEYVIGGIIIVGMIVAGILVARLIEVHRITRAKELAIMEDLVRIPSTSLIIKEVGEAIAKSTVGFGMDQPTEPLPTASAEIVIDEEPGADFIRALRDIEETEWMTDNN